MQVTRAAWLSACLLALAACLPGCTPTRESAPSAGQDTGQAASGGAPAPGAIRLWADSALRPAVQAIASRHEARTGQPVALTFGPSAALRQRISQGQEADVFVAAGSTQPQQLASCGQWQPPAVIAKDSLCLMTAPRLTVAPATALGALLRADVRVGAYQPGAEPLGDAFWQLVDRADQLQSGAHATLTAKVHVLSGGQPLREELMQGRIDAAVQGCIGAGADAASTALGITPLPAALDTGLPYNLTWRLKASEAARQLAQAMQSPEAAQQWRALGLQTP